ncbi:MAG: hypothetical protein P8164_15360 [Gammaproteobacteria bacterium]|jgi:methyl-accepting chemotaxis protein
MDNRRKTLLVNAVQQRRFIMGAVLVAIILINMLVVFAVLVNPVVLGSIQTAQIMSLAAIEAVTVFGIAYFSLILSHKIAGPAYALARDLKKLADGDLTVVIRLRKGDFYLEAADALNFTADVLRTKMKALKQELAKLEAQRNIDDETRQTVERLSHDLAYFKTEPSFSIDHTSRATVISTQQQPTSS